MLFLSSSRMKFNIHRFSIKEWHEMQYTCMFPETNSTGKEINIDDISRAYKSPSVAIAFLIRDHSDYWLSQWETTSHAPTKNDPCSIIQHAHDSKMLLSCVIINLVVISSLRYIGEHWMLVARKKAFIISALRLHSLIRPAGPIN